MLLRNGPSVAILCVCAALVGCATSRSEIKLSSPVAMPPGTAISSGQTAVIRSVKDERVFVEAGPDPSTPSLGFEGAAQASAETKARAIGRKRNGFGKALGDVLLQSGQTVEGVIREHLAAALAQAGYQVQGEDAAGPSPLVIDAHIKQFWAWLRPGWALTLSANIVTELEVSGAAAPTTISVHAEDKLHMATEDAWLQIVGKALDEYRAQVVTKATTLPKSGQGVGAQQ
jgi:hypothetical protein